MRILLVADMLDEHRSLTNLFGKGNPIIWGMLGWCTLLLYIVIVVYNLVKYIRKCLEIKRIKVSCASEKEKSRIKLDSAKLNYEKEKGEDEKEKRRLEREIGKKSKQIDELKKSLFKDFKFFFTKGSKVIEELEKDIKDLEDETSRIVEKIEAGTERYLATCEKLQNEVIDCEEKIEEAECDLKKSKKIFKEKMKKIKAACVIVFLILLTDGNNMRLTAQELKNTLTKSFDLPEDSPVNESETETTTPEDVTMDNEGQNIEVLPDIKNKLREHMDYNFILIDEHLHNVIDDEIEDIISLTDYSKNMIGYEQFLTDCREGCIIEILPKVNYDEEINLNGLLNEIAEDLEKPFLKKIDEGKIIKTQMEWEQYAPNSMELEKIIDKRRQVLGMDESISIRRTIYYRLANDYQRLGKECLIQGKDGTQIYYYYGMSIYCCYCALGYEGTDENSYSDNEILNYARARYKDIMDNEKKGIQIEKVSCSKEMYFLVDKWMKK